MEPGGGGEDVAVVSAAASANLGLTEDSSTTSSRSSSWPYEATSSSAASLPPPPGSPPPIIPHQLPHPSVVHSHPSIPLPPPPSSNIAGHQQPSPTSSSAAAAAVTLSSIAASEAAAAAAAIDIDTYFRGSNGFFAPVQNTYTNGEFIFSRLPSMACRYLFALCYETVLVKKWEKADVIFAFLLFISDFVKSNQVLQLIKDVVPIFMICNICFLLQLESALQENVPTIGTLTNSNFDIANPFTKNQIEQLFFAIPSISH